MTEERRWSDDPAQPMQLREKINTYGGFILDGSLAKHFPETAGERICIQLVCVEAPTGEIAVIVEHGQSELNKVGIDFKVHVWESPPSP